jgi:predicted 3-demethylubiquinone-9 3-methyltransferase (glyoxalase superfamily)
MQKIVPNLWFDTEAEEAATFYTSVFPDSEIVTITQYGDAGPRPAGLAMTVTFRLQGQEFIALNRGPEFTFNEAISLLVNCETQDEVDRYWEKLSQGGEQGVCGWLKDRYGVSWQVVPTILERMVQDEDTERAQRVMRAMLQMKKIEIAGLGAAYRGWARSIRRRTGGTVPSRRRVHRRAASGASAGARGTAKGDPGGGPGRSGDDRLWDAHLPPGWAVPGLLRCVQRPL